MYLKTANQILVLFVIGTRAIMSGSHRTTGITRSYCYGSSNGLSLMGEFEQELVEALRLQYQNCTKVYGNLEITNVTPETLRAAGVDSLDSIFDHIEEVTGYVLIFRNSIPSISLPRLKIIWGDELFELPAGSLQEYYSLAVFANSNLKRVDLRSLRAIQKGDVGVSDTDPCYLAQTVDWGQILDDKKRFNWTHFDDAAPTCKEACGDLQCDASCATNRCWGPSADMCQRIYKNEFCSPSCEKGCFDNGTKSPLHCCHQSCIAGCTGRSASDCVACSHFNDNGKCVDVCPPLEKYSPSAQMHVPNPDGKYTYIRDCVDKCPSHTVVYRGGCVASCPTGFHYLDGSRECQQCDGACPKTCSLSDPKLNSMSLRNMTNCTILEGNMEILTSSFNLVRDVPVNGGLITVPGIKPEALNALQHLRRITGSLKIEARGWLQSLEFLRSLEVIEGRKVSSTGNFALQITNNDALIELRLLKLRRILNGGVFIAENQDLCLVDSIPWEEEILSRNDSRARTRLFNNSNEKDCEDDANIRRICADVCDPTTGCWGSRVSDCFRCRHMKQADVCVTECNSTTHYRLNDEQRVCLPCHLQCNGCNGSTDYNCTLCRNAKKDGRCVESCGLNHFKNATGDCSGSPTPEESLVTVLSFRKAFYLKLDQIVSLVTTADGLKQDGKIRALILDQLDVVIKSLVSMQPSAHAMQTDVHG